MALIALGVSGGIGAYKAVEVCRLLQQRGHDVVAVMTRSATRFVGPLTFEAITRRPVITSQWKPGANADIEHIAIADAIGLLLVAPCTANVIGKLANGIADDFLTSLYLATKAPVLIAPAMNNQMLAHEAVQRNLTTLARPRCAFVEPGEGYLACGWIGKGRLAEPHDIVLAAERVLAPATPTLSGSRVVVTAGPTFEDIDAVRFVGNRSSGGWGLPSRQAHARAAHGSRSSRARPASSVPCSRRADTGAERRRDARGRDASGCGRGCVIMAAAVADYTPLVSGRRQDREIRWSSDADADANTRHSRRPRRTTWHLPRPLLVGFAAETDDVLAKARAKYRRKRVDLIVANDVSQPDRGFDVETNAVTISARTASRRFRCRAKKGSRPRSSTVSRRSFIRERRSSRLPEQRAA